MNESVRIWDLPVRLFHWLLAASFLTAYLISESEDLRSAHLIIGYIATGLILFRIAWGFTGSSYARFSSFLYPPAAAFGYLRALFAGRARRYLGHNPAGSYAIYAMLLLGLLTGISGYMIVQRIGGEMLREVHEISANLWLGVVVMHVLGVLWSSWAHRENLPLAMLSGRKRAPDSGTAANHD